MKHSVVLAASFAALLLGARLVGAQPAPPSFADIDKDKNGSLSKEEVAAWLAGRRAAGAGGGGQGQGQGAPPDPAQVFARWDTNGDGSVSKAEFDARPRPPGAGAGGPPPGAGPK